MEVARHIPPIASLLALAHLRAASSAPAAVAPDRRLAISCFLRWRKPPLSLAKHRMPPAIGRSYAFHESPRRTLALALVIFGVCIAQPTRAAGQRAPPATIPSVPVTAIGDTESCLRDRLVRHWGKDPAEVHGKLSQCPVPPKTETHLHALARVEHDAPDPLRHLTDQDTTNFLANVAAIFADANSPTYLDAPNVFGQSPLHYASRYSTRLPIIETLIRLRADPNRPDEQERTPLHYAALHSTSLPVVRYLIEHGADPNKRDSRGRTPLHYAARNLATPAIVQALLDAGASLRTRDQNGARPRDYAVDPLAIVFDEADGELSNSPDFSQSDVDGLDALDRTPLHYAARSATRLTDVKSLLEDGADLRARDVLGRIPLHYAAGYNEQYEIIEYLLSRDPATLTLTDSVGHTPLHLAAAYNTPKVIKNLVTLRSAATILAPQKGGPSSPLMWAAGYNKHQQGVIYILCPPHEDEGRECQDALLDTPNSVDQIPLHFAAGFNHLAVNKFLLQQGGPDTFNWPDAHDRTPLHWSFLHNYMSEDLPDLVLELIACGAKPNIPDNDSLIPARYPDTYIPPMEDPPPTLNRAQSRLNRNDSRDIRGCARP